MDCYYIHLSEKSKCLLRKLWWLNNYQSPVQLCKFSPGQILQRIQNTDLSCSRNFDCVMARNLTEVLLTTLMAIKLMLLLTAVSDIQNVTCEKAVLNLRSNLYDFNSRYCCLAGLKPSRPVHDACFMCDWLLRDCVLNI